MTFAAIYHGKTTRGDPKKGSKKDRVEDSYSGNVVGVGGKRLCSVFAVRVNGKMCKINGLVRSR